MQLTSSARDKRERRRISLGVRGVRGVCEVVESGGVCAPVAECGGRGRGMAGVDCVMCSIDVPFMSSDGGKAGSALSRGDAGTGNE